MTSVPKGAAMAVERIPVDLDVALEIAGHEAVIRQAYKDSVGVWTWSVGLTSATGHDVTRYIDNPASLKRCLEVYAWALTSYAAGVRKAFAGKKLTKAQFTGALSFHWNTGKIGKASWVKKFKAGDIAGARLAFILYNKPPEIEERREKERDLFFDGIWSNDGKMTEFTQLTKKHTPVWKSGRKVEVAAILRAALASPVTPELDHSPKPNAQPGAPTLSPSPRPASERPSRPQAIAAIDTSTIEQVQLRLRELGYTEVGDPNGRSGKLTETAILAFRNEHDLPLTPEIDDDLLAALAQAEPREMAESRAEAKPAEVRAQVPEVKANFLSQVWAWVLGIPAAVGGVISGAMEAIPGAKGILEPVREFATDVPGWMWFVGVGVVALVIVLIARGGHKDGLEAFRAGERR